MIGQCSTGLLLPKLAPPCIYRKPPDVSGAGLLLRGPPLSPGVVRGVGTTSRDPLPRAPLSVGASAAEWEILDGKRVDSAGAPADSPPGPAPLTSGAPVISGGFLTGSSSFYRTSPANTHT